MALIRLGAVGFVLIACSDCSRTTEPIPPELRVSGIDIPGLTITLRPSRSGAAVGDSLTFVIVAHNSTAEEIQVGGLCGPSMDVRVRAPNGSYSSALMDQFADSDIPVAFTCELGRYHFAPPRDSLLNVIRWRAPSRGTFTALAGGRRSDGLHDVSHALTLTVR